MKQFLSDLGKILGVLIGGTIVTVILGHISPVLCVMVWPVIIILFVAGKYGDQRPE